MRTTLVTWNLKGSADPDLAGVVAHLRAEGADLALLQEVQWHQARRIARGLGARSHRWSFKHFPLRTWPEGMAIVGVTRPVRVRSRALTHRWRVWSWRRRIVQVATVDGALTLVNVHLTPHGDAAGLREVEAGKVLALVATRTAPVVVAGDFNDRPGGPIGVLMGAAGLRDGWPPPPAGEAEGGGTPARDPWPTSWRGWRRGTREAPTRRLDYVYVSSAVQAVAVTVPAAGDGDLSRFSALSDHLPVTAVLDS